MWYTPWVVSEHVPDLSTLERLVASPRFADKSGQELVIALWEFIVDEKLGIFHYIPPVERLWGQDVYDPLKILNECGFTICHCHAHMLAMIYRVAGFEARIANIRGHEGTEVFYDGAWHYFDCDIQMFHRLRPPNEHVVASRQQLYEDPSLVSDQPTPSLPYCLPDRLPETVQPLYEAEPSLTALKEEKIHAMDFVLRPGEELTRLFRHRGRWIMYEHYPRTFKRWRAETGWEGPTERFWPRRTLGNGLWRYAPKLGKGWRDLELGAESVDGLDQAEGGLRLHGDSGSVTFVMQSPYIFCGVPDPYRNTPSQHGSLIHLTLDLPEGAVARIEGATGRSDDWQEIWRSQGEGEVSAEVDFTPLAEAEYRVRLRFVLEGVGAMLKDLEIGMYVMCSPHSLPALRNAGPNRMSLHCGDAYDLKTKPLLIEHKFDGGDSVPGAYATVNCAYDPSTYSRVMPVDESRPWEIVYEVAAPDGGMMAWLTAFAVIEGRKPDEPYDGHEALIAVAESPDGPWEPIASQEILEHELGWHFGVYGEKRLSGQTPSAYVKVACKKGMLGIRMNGHYLPADAGSPDGPMEIEHQWYEVDPRVGRRLRSHVETVTAESHEYTVTCATEPHDEAVIQRMASVPAGG